MEVAEYIILSAVKDPCSPTYLTLYLTEYVERDSSTPLRFGQNDIQKFDL